MGRKRKITAAKSVNSDIHTDQDKTCISHNVSDKDSKIMEQMTSLKESKPEATEIKGKKVSHTTQVSKPDITKIDGSKRTKCIGIVTKGQNKKRNELQESCNDVRDDAHSEKQCTNSKKKTGRGREIFNRGNRRGADGNNAVDENKESKLKLNEAQSKKRGGQEEKGVDKVDKTEKRKRNNIRHEEYIEEFTEEREDEEEKRSEENNLGSNDNADQRSVEEENGTIREIADINSEEDDEHYYYDEGRAFAELQAYNEDENEVIPQNSEDGKEQDNEMDLLPYEPLDTDLIDDDTMDRINEVNIDELEGDNHLFLNLNRVYVDVQLLRLITPNSSQKAVVYGARRRTNNQEVIFSRLLLCRIHSEQNYNTGSKLIYLMESKNSNKCMFDKNVELRDNGVISIGTFFRIISPHPIENKMRGDIPLLKTDIPLIVMTRPTLEHSIPVYKELGEHNSMAFVLVGMKVNINRSSPIQTTCGGLLCDKQRCDDWNGTRGCGCYHMSPDISSIVFQHSVFFSVGNDRIYHSNFSSNKFSSFYLSRRLPGSTPVSTLRVTKDFWDIEDCIKNVLDLVNRNGGWTVVGWYKRGVITDKSLLEVPLSNAVSTQVAAGQINYHIVQMIPTNKKFLVRDTELYKDLQREKYNVGNLTERSS